MVDSELREVLHRFQEEMLSSQKQAVFVKAFERISARYRNGEGGFLQTDEERKAYLFTRLPGTFSAVLKVLEEVKQRAPSLQPISLLDVGAGPGTGMWAALEVFSTLSSCTLLEKDPSFMAIGKELAKRSSFSFIQKAVWKSTDLERLEEVPSHDLTLLSYSIGELKEVVFSSLLTTLWKATKKAIVLIEPGTPKGYSRLMKIRDFLLGLGAYLWAPCPHSRSCPLLQGDWCHFSVRVPRSSFHRKLKSADLGYEDEKFSYLVFGREPIILPQGRVIRHPIKHSGHVELMTCRTEGIKKDVYSKKDKDLYKQMKGLDWSDCF